MKYFSWKWVAFGLAYSLFVMSILNMGMPAEVNSKLVPAEWLRIIYDILTAGWGNLTVITMISVLAFSTFPRAIEKKDGLSSPMHFLMMLAGLVLVYVLAVVLAGMLTNTPLTVLVVVLPAMMLVVVMPALVYTILCTIKNIFRSTARNVRMVLAKND